MSKHTDSEEDIFTQQKLSTKEKREKDGFIGDSNSDDDDDASMFECTPTQIFQGYQMNFLKYPINFIFNMPVKLVKKKFNFLVRNINEYDRKRINRIFKRLSPELKLKSGDTYMNSKNTTFTTSTFPRNKIDFMDEKEWRPRISIQGFKTNNNEHLSPIWKINEAILL